MSRRLPWLKFYTSDFIAFTSSMNPEEVGALILIIAATQERGEPLEDDLDRLRLVLNCSRQRARKLVEALEKSQKISRKNGKIFEVFSKKNEKNFEKTLKKHGASTEDFPLFSTDDCPPTIYQREKARNQTPNSTQIINDNHSDERSTPAQSADADDDFWGADLSIDAEWRTNMLHAIGLDESGLTGRGSKYLGTQSDMETSKKWERDLGLSRQQIIDELKFVMESRKSTSPPNTFSYFSPAMVKLSQELKKELPTLQEVERINENSARSNKPGATSLASVAARRIIQNRSR